MPEMTMYHIAMVIILEARVGGSRAEGGGAPPSGAGVEDMGGVGMTVRRVLQGMHQSRTSPFVRALRFVCAFPFARVRASYQLHNLVCRITLANSEWRMANGEWRDTYPPRKRL